MILHAVAHAVLAIGVVSAVMSLVVVYVERKQR